LGCIEDRFADSAIRGRHFDLDLGFGDPLLDKRLGGFLLMINSRSGRMVLPLLVPERLASAAVRMSSG
jgi:hypothetical protein